MTPRDVLIAARAKIERPEDWCQCHYVSLDGAMCMIGALESVVRESTTDYSESKKALANACKPSDGPLTFNDECGRTHAEVLAAFDRAIASLPEDA